MGEPVEHLLHQSARMRGAPAHALHWSEQCRFSIG